MIFRTIFFISYSRFNNNSLINHKEKKEMDFLLQMMIPVVENGSKKAAEEFAKRILIQAGSSLILSSISRLCNRCKGKKK